MSERFDIYAPIHKGLRLGSARMLERLGRADWADPAERAAVLAELRDQLGLGREHIEHEEAELHDAVRGHAPTLAKALDHEHQEHLLAFERLEALIHDVETAPEARRARAGHALYLAFSIHFAEDMLHMAHEEHDAMPLLQDHYSDEALMAMDARIVQTIPPERMGDYLRLMIPAATPEGRAALLGAIRQGVPPEVFAGILDGIARPSLSPREWRLLEQDLVLPA
ncbi:hypothetical protein J8J14_15235 [Roseomonas sp. SSH11]|uniref:Hemerythrin-like domain-containing protein n=1 Tax=Pararoseomonas baculiformis TaxID=2820812 RepID=A0ABS4AGG9_9PROT|nr:hypothetical protein [Pararoseomonas baculiformis]MBP0446127.1 hypothetical protein [Pararoseomonas baculiformis]